LQGTVITSWFASIPMLAALPNTTQLQHARVHPSFYLQIFFSGRTPLLRRGLSLRLRLLYTTGTWSYVCNIVTSTVFLLIPFNRQEGVRGVRGVAARDKMDLFVVLLAKRRCCLLLCPRSLVLGLHPCTFSKFFAAASLIHLLTGQLLSAFCREPGQLRIMWLAGVSNQLLAFTFVKAIVNTLL
jgi:hypothetical protein